MIDVHSHILPDLDDGSPDLTYALSVIADAASQGVRAIFATPHCCDGVYNCRKADILSEWQNLCETLEDESVDIQVLPGAEIRVNHDLVERLDAGDLLTLGDAGKFILLELPPVFIDHAVFEMMSRLKQRKVIPIIAHAERNPMIAGRPDLAAELQFLGAKIQVTAGSLTGDFGKPVFKVARELVEKNRVFCLGSDMHPGRNYRMKAAEKKLNKWIGPEKTHALVVENPEQILSGCYSPAVL